MKRTASALLLSLLPLLGCATSATTPVAVSCPKPAELPAVLTDKSASTGPSLAERIESLFAGFEAWLTKGTRPE